MRLARLSMVRAVLEITNTNINYEGTTSTAGIHSALESRHCFNKIPKHFKCLKL